MVLHSALTCRLLGYTEPGGRVFLTSAAPAVVELHRPDVWLSVQQSVEVGVVHVDHGAVSAVEVNDVLNVRLLGRHQGSQQEDW